MSLDLTAWPGLELGERLDVGYQNSVWMGSLTGEAVSIRRLRRSLESFEWELDLIAFLHASGVRVSEPIRTVAGELHSDGIAVFRWLEGREPETEAEWRAVAAELKLVHELTIGYPQRPECCVVTELREKRKSLDADIDELPRGVADLVLDIFDKLEHVERAVVHGKPISRNIGISKDGRVGIFNWDVSHVDLIWHDMPGLGVQVLSDEDHQSANILSLAWSIANNWLLDAKHAEVQLTKLVESLDLFST